MKNSGETVLQLEVNRGREHHPDMKDVQIHMNESPEHSTAKEIT
jgi:hypothetical protein